jgi:hypothetical protein
VVEVVEYLLEVLEVRGVEVLVVMTLHGIVKQELQIQVVVLEVVVVLVQVEVVVQE